MTDSNQTSSSHGTALHGSSAPTTKVIQQAITITGSRDVTRQAARPQFEVHLAAYLDQGRTWLLGSALGVDRWATEWLLDLAEQCWVVVPFTASDQPRDAGCCFDRVARLIELNLPRSKRSYMIRNRYMVDRSEVVVGFWSGKPGGTRSTLQYAIRERREVHLIPIPVGNDSE